MKKKQLYIVIGIFAIITLGFLLAAFIVTRGGKTQEGTNDSFANFFPFGKQDDQNTTLPEKNTPSDNNENILTENRAKKDLPILREITKNPVAGYYATEKVRKPYVNFMEKETGNVYEIRMEDMQTNRLSNSLIPRISEAFFANKGKNIVARYLKNGSDTIFSFILDISGTESLSSENATSTGTSVPNGRFLPSGISEITLSSDKKTAFYLTKSDTFSDRSSFGSIYDFEKKTTSEVFQSPFSEWIPISFDGKSVLLQTKASQKVPGFLYSFDIKTGILQKILGNINGLMALPSPDRTRILYSESTLGGLALHFYNTKDGSIVSTTVQTLPEKCVWKSDNMTVYCGVPNNMAGGAYPDLWYQGIVSFTDSFWKIDAKTGKGSIIPSSFTSEPMDIVFLSFSPIEDYLFFINKRDSSLWAFNIEKVE
jgi:hypothetical protein